MLLCNEYHTVSMTAPSTAAAAASQASITSPFLFLTFFSQAWVLKLIFFSTQQTNSKPSLQRWW